jgi:hypothetical protein
MADTPEAENPRNAGPIRQELSNHVTVICPKCGIELLFDQFAQHLEMVHDLSSVEDKNQAYQDAFQNALLGLHDKASCLISWKVLVQLAKDFQGDQAMAFLATSLTQGLRHVAYKKRAKAISISASAISQSPEGPKLLVWLAGQTHVTGHRLALAILVRIGPGISAGEVRIYLPLLGHRRLPTREAVAAAARLLEILGKDEADIAVACEALAAGRKRKRAIARLTLLEKRIGSFSSLLSVRQRLINQGQMRCPKCNAKMARSNMIGHLWQEHQLILEANKARMPWSLLEEWIANYGDEQNGILLDKCRQLVTQLDPNSGPLRLERLILAKGIDDVKARRFLVHQAESAYACVCPHCFGLVPRPRPAFVNKLVVSRSRLGYMGYSVEIKETGLFPRLLVQTPNQLIFKGREPGARLTRRATFLAILPLLLLSLAFAFGLVSIGVRVLIPVSTLLLVSLILVVRDRSQRRRTIKAPVRALGYVWNMLVPNLHTPDFKQEDAAFLAGLAVLTATRETFHIPPQPLERCLTITERTVASGSAESVYLAALRRIIINGHAGADHDPIAEIAKQIGRCFDGPLSLSYAEELLDVWKADWLTPAALARLRVLVCDKAFEAGFELASFRHALRNRPTLREMVGFQDMRALAQLRLLWSLRPRRPWDRYGKAATAFELAEEDKPAKWLGRYPDLLLLADMNLDHYARPTPRSSKDEHLIICSRGVVLQGKMIGEHPHEVDITKAKRSEGGGYHLRVGSTIFQFEDEPQEIAAQVESWCRFAFLEFRPQADDVVNWKAPDNPARMRARGAVQCAECRGWMLARVGEVGVPLDDPDPITFEVI